MRKSRLRRPISLMFIIMAMVVGLSSPPVTQAQVKTIPKAGIAINGKMVSGITPVVVNGTMYLPFVQLSKILGYNDIQYNIKNATFQVTDGSTLLRAVLGGAIAFKSNEYIHIEPLRTFNKTVYISLSSGSDLFNVFLYYVPRNGSIQVEKPARHYIVQDNETLYGIARAHHTTVNQLKAANNLKSNIIFVGSKLKIPSWGNAREMEPVREKSPVVQTKAVKNVESVRSNVVIHAKKYIGAKYKYGATTTDIPNKFDCSSFTQHVFKKNGYILPRTSREQASKGVNARRLMQGDLLFFTDKKMYSDGRVGHIGIYMADGSMIHASSSKGVIITKNVLKNPYWSKNYLFAKRVIK